MDTESTDTVRQSIYEYFQWCKRNNSDSDGKRDLSSLLEAFETAFPESSLFTAGSNREPILLSAINIIKKKKERIAKSSKFTVFTWDDYMESLQSMREQNSFPADSMEPRGFLSWCVNQRYAYNNRGNESESHLTKDRIEKLKDIGFCWEQDDNPNNVANQILIDRQSLTDAQKRQWFKLFRLYKSALIESNTSTPKSAKIDQNLKRRATLWLESQIVRYRDWDAGFVDFPIEHRNALAKAKLLPQLELSENRDFLLGKDYEEGQEQEVDSDETEIEEERPPRHEKAKRKSIDENDESLAMTLQQKRVFERRMKELLKFKKKHHHTHVTHSMNQSLATWMKKERMKFRKNPRVYNKEKKRRLDEIGFQWEPRAIRLSADFEPENNPRLAALDDTWFEHLEALQEFKDKFGHIHVPRRYKEDPELANWVRHQREKFRRAHKGLEKIPKRRYDALVEIGFTIGAGKKKMESELNDRTFGKDADRAERLSKRQKTQQIRESNLEPDSPNEEISSQADDPPRDEDEHFMHELEREDSKEQKSQIQTSGIPFEDKAESRVEKGVKTSEKKKGRANVDKKTVDRKDEISEEQQRTSTEDTKSGHPTEKKMLIQETELPKKDKDSDCETEVET